MRLQIYDTLLFFNRTSADVEEAGGLALTDAARDELSPLALADLLTFSSNCIELKAGESRMLAPLQLVDNPSRLQTNSMR